MIGWENYEEYLIMHADGELLPAEEQELMAFINAYPQLKNELHAYKLTHLLPDKSLQYPDKASLLRKARTKRIILLPVWVKYGIAASVAFILFISLYKYKELNNNTLNVVGADTIKNTLPAARNTALARKKPDSIQNIALAPVQAARTLPVHNIQNATVARNIRPASKQPVINVPVKSNILPATATMPIKPLPVAAVKTLQSPTNIEIPVTLANVPPLPAIPNEAEAKRPLWDRLPIEDEKKERVQHIADVIAAVYSGTDKTDDNSDDKKISIKIEPGKIKIFF